MGGSSPKSFHSFLVCLFSEPKRSAANQKAARQIHEIIRVRHIWPVLIKTILIVEDKRNSRKANNKWRKKELHKGTNHDCYFRKSFFIWFFFVFRFCGVRKIKQKLKWWLFSDVENVMEMSSICRAIERKLCENISVWSQWIRQTNEKNCISFNESEQDFVFGCKTLTRSCCFISHDSTSFLFIHIGVGIISSNEVFFFVSFWHREWIGYFTRSKVSHSSGN